MASWADALMVVALPYRRAGKGTPFVLVHGFFGGSLQWDDQIQYFQHNFDVIAPDLPGFGDAHDLPSLDRVEKMADAIICLLDQLGVDQFILMGHSMGGMIAQDIAAKVGDRIAKLILYGTGPLGSLPDRFESIAQSQERLCRDGVSKTVQRITATWLRDGEKADGYELLKSIGACASQQAAFDGLEAMQHWDGRTLLKDLMMPTLVLWGDLDRSYRWSQVETLWKSLCNGYLSVIPDAAHAAHLEKPHLFHVIVEDFLA